MIPQARPAVVDPTPRYWRRRANFRVRRKRWTRTARRWSVVLAINVTIGGALLQSGTKLAERIRNSEYFSVKRIEITGTTRSDPGEVRARLEPYLGTNLLDVNLHDVKVACSGSPWIADADPKVLLPSTLRVRLGERVPYVVAVIGGIAHVVDRGGNVIGPSGSELADNLPVIVGLEGRDDDDLIGGLRRGVELVGRLREAAPSWLTEISEIDLSDPGVVRVNTMGGGPRILLDPDAVERNLGSYLALKDRLGELVYVDLRWRGRINVMPRSPVNTMEES